MEKIKGKCQRCKEREATGIWHGKKVCTRCFNKLMHEKRWTDYKQSESKFIKKLYG
jgi:hypothetical protein